MCALVVRAYVRLLRTALAPSTCGWSREWTCSLQTGGGLPSQFQYWCQGRGGDQALWERQPPIALPRPRELGDSSIVECPTTVSSRFQCV